MSSALFGLTCPSVPGSVQSASERTLQQASVVGRFTRLSQPPPGGALPQKPGSPAFKASTTNSTPHRYLCAPEPEPVPFHRSPRGVLYLPAPFRVFANARLGHCSCLLSDKRLSPHMYLSACTRPLRGRVHPHTGVDTSTGHLPAPSRVSAPTRPPVPFRVLRGRVHPNTGAHPKRLSHLHQPPPAGIPNSFHTFTSTPPACIPGPSSSTCPHACLRPSGCALQGAARARAG